jgi:hypothetical protein
VGITSVGAGELIVRNSGNTAWINQTLAEAGISEVGHTHGAGDVISGTFNTARIPNLPASKITSGTFDIERIPATVQNYDNRAASGTFTTTYTTYATATITTDGRPVLVNWSAMYSNANSGANRLVSFRVLRNSSAVGLAYTNLFVPLVSGSSTPYVASGTFIVTQSAGTYNFNLQAQANTNGAVGAGSMEITAIQL